MILLLAACGSPARAVDAGCVTTLSGTVFAPNGTLPIWNAQVYLSATPAPITDGPQCDDGCTQAPNAVATDEHGAFSLQVLPGDDLPLVVETGKWRRTFTVPHAEACTDTPLDPDRIRLPRFRSEGAIPRIAISTGDSDALECLVTKLGVGAEITNTAAGGRINLFSDRQAAGQGASHFANGMFFDDSAALWADVATLSQYDLVLLSCEGAPYPQTKTTMDLNAMLAYANAGGRIYASHWHDYWIEQRWASVATFDDTAAPLPDGSVDTIDQSTAHGKSFAKWMGTNEVPLAPGTGKQAAQRVAQGDVWVWHDQQPQMFAFTTPADAPCGRVVYTDMHVSGDSTSRPDVAYPGGCATTDLTPQEKALAFALFDLGSCVGLR